MLRYYWNKIKEKSLLHKGQKVQAALAPPLSIAQSPLFIVSCGRSGTTLFRKMLMRGGEIHIPPESDDLIPYAIQYYVKHSHETWATKVKHILEHFQKAACFEFWAIDLKLSQDELLQLPKEHQNLHSIINHIYEQHKLKFNPTATRIGEKTPYLVLRLEWVRLLYPNAPILHLLRDGRAVVASRMEAFGETLEQASNRWLWSLKEIEKLKKQKNIPFLEIRYEDLVAAPEQILKEVCTFAKLEYNPEMLSNKKIDMGDDVITHHANTKENKIIDTKDKWKTAFSEKEHDVLLKKIGKELRANKYQI